MATGGQWNEFLDLPPGDYQVRTDGAETVGGRITVLAGSQQEVQVSLGPR